MKINIAEKTDIEIQEIICKLIKNGYCQVDEAYVERDGPFKIKPNSKNEYKIGLVLYPELLTYHNGSNWITVPWICVRTEFLHNDSIGESFKINFVKWLYNELKSIGFTPFKDEDAFAGCSSKEETIDSTKIKLFINPDFPKGYWSNHTLQ